MSFPEEFLRGITQKEQIDDDGYARTSVFIFHERNNQESREDNNLEKSINWRDDEGADKLLFNQRKDDGKLQFIIGAALASRKKLDSVIRSKVVKGTLSYERKKIPGNPYHGNLLMSKEIPKKTRRRFAATIATMCVQEIIPNPNENSGQ